MPRGILYFIYQGNAISYKTGRKLKSIPTSDQIKSGDYILQPVPDPDEFFRAIKTVSDLKSLGYRRIRRANYNNPLNRVIPEFKNYIAPTQKGTPRKIGQGRDSFLTHLNQSMAQLNNVPITPENRRVLRDIYADEISTAFKTAGSDFLTHKSEFITSRRKPKAKLYRSVKTPNNPYYQM